MSEVLIKPKSGRNMHAIILFLIGIVSLISGVAIATVHNPLRGSGLGTLLSVLGVALFFIAFLRFAYKRS